MHSAVDLVSDNLPKVKNLLWDASPDWFDLGLELGIGQTTLRAIQHDNRDVTKRCFTDMLSEWLKMVDPIPSWEGLIAALKQPSIGHNKLATKVEKEVGITVQSDDSEGANGKHAIRLGRIMNVS